jgi:multiple antibiotic resistance protein
MNISINEILSVSMILFAIIDILGSIPIVIELRNRVGHIQSEKATLVALVIMVIFLFLGESILGIIGVDIKSFAIAGSIVIFIMAMEMILGVHLFKDNAPETASIVPLAFPLIAGSGVMTTLLSLRAEYQTINIIFGIFINLFFVFVVLKNVHKIEAMLGKSGVDVLRKVFGIILLVIAVKLFRTNTGF